MRRLIVWLAVVVTALFFCSRSAAQEPKSEVRLRFDEAQREQVDDLPDAISHRQLSADSLFAYKLNRKRVSELDAYQAVTLWNVRRVCVKNRRMRLCDTTARQKVRLLKFFTERNRKKGARPHLLGNVGACSWSSGYWDEQAQRLVKQPMHIRSYALRSQSDSIRKANPDLKFSDVLKQSWRVLAPDAVYILNGQPTPGVVFRFFDGLILRTLDVFTDPETMARYQTRSGVVIGDTYPDRIPLVVLNGEISSVATWLELCRADAFAMDADVPMNYYFIQPVEAVQLYGVRGKYGVICINIVQ